MPKRLRIFFNYRTVASPWGGANSFLRSLQAALSADPEVEIVSGEYAECDVFFLNQLYRGPGRPRFSRKFLSPAQIRRLSRSGTTCLWRALRHRMTGEAIQLPAVVCRLVNHAEHAYGKVNREQADLFGALTFTTADIFQTRYLYEVFQASGYKKTDPVVIHNGVNQEIFHPRRRVAWHPGKPLVVVSSAMTLRRTKRFDLIAAVSLLPGVESHHAGIWPEDVPRGRVRLLGRLTHGEIASFFREKAHVFMHPAEKDICPNAVVEAMSCGLPVFFSQLGGTAELVGACGIALVDGIELAVKKMQNDYRWMQELLQKRQPYFSIARAAAEYKAVFRRAAEARSLMGAPTFATGANERLIP
ncbi:MAG: glycosyltransferase [Proteobacteria bacterium]|nr:glycosyltransferase [Pseudomonadota bacterium]NBS05996.1 glycosyltransferase [Verrucomicrobiota bacterium]NBS49123.1 glycosyltransferase [Verrucomicrobiota bacterium]NBS78435.1 glycosyltransferase [bacterium]